MESPAAAVPWTRSERTFLAIAVLVALLMRLLHWTSMAPHPWFDFLGLDAKYYDEWAQRLLAEGLQGREPYFMGPLYPHVLAMVYSVAGRSLDAMRGFQVVLSSGTVVLVHLLARAYGGPRLARVSSAMTAIYGPLVYYSVSLLYPTLTVFLATALLLCLHQAARTRSLRWAALAGVALGTFALGRGNILLFAPVAFFWLAMAWGAPQDPRRSRFREGLRGSLVLTAATVACILPATLHNLRAGDPTLLTTNGGLNLYIGNGPMARGGHETPVLLIDRPDGTRETITADLQKDVECRTEAEYVTGRSMKYTEVSRFYLDLTLDHIRAHPGQFLSKLLMKSVHFWSTYEIPQIEHFGYFRRFSLPLKGPVFSFGILGPLAFVGMGFAWRRRRAWALPFLFVLTYSAATVLFFVLARYRLPIVPALFLFGAFGLVCMYEAARARQWPRIGVAFGAAVAIRFLMGANLYGVDEERGIAQILYRHGIVADAGGDLPAAIEHYQSALELNPEYAKCHLNLGVDLARVGRPEEGLVHLTAAEQLDPEYYRAPFNRGIVLEELDRLDEAAAAYRRAVELEPRYLVAHLAEAELLLVENDRAGAAERLQRIAAYDDRWVTPAHEQAQRKGRILESFLQEVDRLAARGLGDCFAVSRPYRRAELARMRGDSEQALTFLRRCFEPDAPVCPEAYRLLGMILTVANQREGALDAYLRAAAAEPRLPGVHLGLARMAAAAGDGAAAMAELEEEVRWNPDHVDAYLEAGLVQERLFGDHEAALAWFQKYEDKGGDPAVLAGRRSSWGRAQGIQP